jgi:hypothetical protein
VQGANAVGVAVENIVVQNNPHPVDVCVLNKSCHFKLAINSV